ncbi:hypothetical protein SO802_025553 [Lithocarpus litseifolius]|uniref:Uncharacterized protein n=1 Tax=Lithocarpus litseifolius TaxID=425828 RepID=A0AAW2BYR2_9ROSI
MAVAAVILAVLVAIFVEIFALLYDSVKDVDAMACSAPTFNPSLETLKSKLDSLLPRINEIRELTGQLDLPKEDIWEMMKGEKLNGECLKN